MMTDTERDVAYEAWVNGLLSEGWPAIPAAECEAAFDAGADWAMRVQQEKIDRLVRAVDAWDLWVMRRGTTELAPEEIAVGDAFDALRGRPDD